MEVEMIDVTTLGNPPEILDPEDELEEVREWCGDCHEYHGRTARKDGKPLSLKHTPAGNWREIVPGLPE